MYKYILLLLISLQMAFGQQADHIDSTSAIIEARYKNAIIPINALQNIELINNVNTPIKDIVRGIGTKFDVNVFISNNINQVITLRLANVTPHRVFTFIAEEYGLALMLDDEIYKFTLPEIHMPEPEPEPIRIFFSNDSLSVDLRDENLIETLRMLSKVSEKAIMPVNGLENGKISGFFNNVPFEDGLNQLLSVNGYKYKKQDNIYIVDRHFRFTRQQDHNQPAGGLWIEVHDDLVTLEAQNAQLGQIIQEIAHQMNVDVFCYGEIKGTVTAKCRSIPFARVLDFLFKGTPYTYRYEENAFFIGDKKISGIATTRLIELNHVKVEGITEILPQYLTSNLTLNVIKEHNAIMAVGSQDLLIELENYIKQFDNPIQQILIEALVVDYTDNESKEFGIQAWMKSAGDSTAPAAQLFPGVNVTASAANINKSLNFYAPQFGLSKIGKLPSDFMLQIKAMEERGTANVRSIPQIATLNGHPANISIGTTQYYKLLSETPVVGGNQAFNQVTQRFEEIKAEISLSITPWVSASGEITTEILQIFSTPRGFDPEIPPTIDHRTLESTVRLRDGETIVLGGLVQTNESENIKKLPILGDIPILGRLFQNRIKNEQKSKLMIYITPHLMYSEDSDPKQGEW